MSGEFVVATRLGVLVAVLAVSAAACSSPRPIASTDAGRSEAARTLLDLLDVGPPVPVVEAVAPRADAAALADSLELLSRTPVDQAQRGAFAAALGRFQASDGLVASDGSDPAFVTRELVVLASRLDPDHGVLTSARAVLIATSALSRLRSGEDPASGARDLVLIGALVTTFPRDGQVAAVRRSATQVSQVDALCRAAASVGDGTDAAVLTAADAWVAVAALTTDRCRPAPGLAEALVPMAAAAAPRGTSGTGAAGSGSAAALEPGIHLWTDLSRWPGWFAAHRALAVALRGRLLAEVQAATGRGAGLGPTELSLLRSVFEPAWHLAATPSPAARVVAAAEGVDRWQGAVEPQAAPTLATSVAVATALHGLEQLQDTTRPGTFTALVAATHRATAPVATADPILVALGEAPLAPADESTRVAGPGDTVLGDAGPSGVGAALIWGGARCHDLPSKALDALVQPTRSGPQLASLPPLLAAVPALLARVAPCVGAAASRSAQASWNRWLDHVGTDLPLVEQAWIRAEWGCQLRHQAPDAAIGRRADEALAHTAPGPGFDLYGLYAAVRLSTLVAHGCTPPSWRSGVLSA